MPIPQTQPEFILAPSRTRVDQMSTPTPQRTTAPKGLFLPSVAAVTSMFLSLLLATYLPLLRFVDQVVVGMFGVCLAVPLFVKSWDTSMSRAVRFFIAVGAYTAIPWAVYSMVGITLAA